jgi:hypothetical protein
LFDELFMKHLGDVALREGDYLLGQILYSLGEDNLWQQRWSMALVQVALEDTPSNKSVIQGWVDKWYFLAMPAIREFSPVLAETQNTERTRPTPDIIGQVDAFYINYLESMHLSMPARVEDA